MKKKLVNEWTERGKNDLEVAKILLKKKDYFDIVLFHIQQAVEKYLKGFLIQKGWKLKKIHDLEILITEAIQFDKGFQNFLNFSRKLTAFYYEERYPPGSITSLSQNEIQEILDIAERLINRIRKNIY
ncbi:MAG: HEPN domain-containing protein [Candidatus Helarchaeota archaeon]